VAAPPGGAARLDRAVLADGGLALPGLPSLFTALAGEPVRPDTPLAGTAETVTAAPAG